MTEKSLQKSFSQHGVIKYGAVGDVFDPALHDALFAVPDATKTSGDGPLHYVPITHYAFCRTIRLFLLMKKMCE